jgi:hypothetical protein
MSLSPLSVVTAVNDLALAVQILAPLANRLLQSGEITQETLFASIDNLEQRIRVAELLAEASEEEE